MTHQTNSIMPENSPKNSPPWTEAHEAFCYQHHIPPAAKILWQWLMRQGQIASEIEPDLSEFNTWVAWTVSSPSAKRQMWKFGSGMVNYHVKLRT
ncbi:hypothetical protein NIES4072_40320 [Nostoc commune NIES-4072]|uniref:Uncharacterized protein n=1 Tax=Nostoc commune NIES-4072 TaxID=2005467 RepID=A0A2R5FPZ1_NOSCO|nr:hypothetical protein [Nostoc commune]GBG20355.1 hypothetical protein NIES4072_40320 [Nostoc commune NIES-4072]